MAWIIRGGRAYEYRTVRRDGKVRHECEAIDGGGHDIVEHVVEIDVGGHAQTQTKLPVGGPHLAAQALKAGLVDEVRLLLSPAIVGAGNAALPDGLRMALELLEQRRFGNGVVYVRYRVAG